MGQALRRRLEHVHVQRHVGQEYLDRYESFIDAKQLVPSVVNDLHEIARLCEAVVEGGPRGYERNAPRAWQIARSSTIRATTTKT